MTTRKHHFVSQFYLRNFSTGVDEKAGLHAFERDTGRIFPIKVKDAAAKRDFNRLDIEGVDQNQLESKLNEIETDCAPQFKKIIKDKSFDFHSRDALTTFVALMFLNGQQTRGILEDFLEGKGQLQVDLWLNQKNLHEKLGVTLEEAEQVRKAYQHGGIKVNPNQNYIIKLQFSNLMMIRNIVEKRKWAFLSASKGNQFITCDNPICLEYLESAFKKPDDFLPAPSIFAPEAVLLFPISSKLLLIGSLESKFKEGGNMQASYDEVAVLNSLIARNSIRHFFARDTDFSIKSNEGKIIEAKKLEEYLKNQEL